jgi:hypothetical protein
VSGETDLATLLASMRPELHDGAYEFVTVDSPTPADLGTAIVVVHESEGVTLVRRAGGGDMAWITLTVHSSLEAVGLTAAVATALAQHGIACNVVAGFHHDHLFVPRDRAADALAALAAL